MKIRTAEHIFDEPWELVVRAQFRKYPNKLNQAVEGIDVVDRTVDQAGVLRSHRLLTTRWGLPGWATKIIGSDGLGYGSEHSEVNPQAKSMEMKTRNLNFCSIITVDEKMSYTQHPQDANKTVLQQESVVNVRGVPLSSYIEHFVIDNIAKNADKGRQAIEIVMAKIKQESVELQHSAKQRLEALNHMTFPDPTSF